MHVAAMRSSKKWHEGRKLSRLLPLGMQPHARAAELLLPMRFQDKCDVVCLTRTREPLYTNHASRLWSEGTGSSVPACQASDRRDGACIDNGHQLYRLPEYESRCQSARAQLSAAV